MLRRITCVQKLDKLIIKVVALAVARVVMNLIDDDAWKCVVARCVVFECGVLVEVQRQWVVQP